MSKNNVCLLPCPCCGDKAELKQSWGRAFTFFVVMCTKCGLQTKELPDEDMAAERWNKRI